MGEERGAVIELPHNSWSSLKAHISGRLGELFALAWLARQRGPEGEIWGLRRGLEGGRKTFPVALWGRLSEARGEFSRAVQPLLEAMAPPPTHSLLGLPRSVKRGLEPLLSAWIPKRGEESGVARLLLSFLEKRGWPWGSSKEALVRELERLYPGVEVEEALTREVLGASLWATGRAASYVVATSASEFKALDLVLKACSAGDFVLLKWRELRKLERLDEPASAKPLFRITAVLRAPKGAKASWVVEVKPREVGALVERRLRSLLCGAAELRWRGRRLYVYGAVSREVLEEALELARSEVLAELELCLRLLGRYPRVPSSAPARGVEFWEGELKGVEVIEVKTGTGRLSETQERLLEELRGEAERAREALDRPIEVSFRILRVELEGFEVPRRTSVSEEKLL